MSKDNNAGVAKEAKADAAVAKELETLELEEKRLRVQDLRMRVERETAFREQREAASRAQQEQLDQANRNIRASQSLCKHRKGGKNLQGIQNGNDQNYSILKHTHAWGDIQVMCTRCAKEWWPPMSEWRRINEPAAYAAAKKDREEYKRQLDEYNFWLNAETDNEPSGTQLFLIVKAPPTHLANA